MLWWRLSLREDFLAAFRETFGNERLIHIAASLVAGVNHVNRSMGLSDLYPFVLSDVALRKLAFVHDWLRRGAQGL